MYIYIYVCIFFEKLSVSCQGVPKKWMGFHAYSQDAVHRGLKILETPSLAMKERAWGIFSGMNSYPGICG